MKYESYDEERRKYTVIEDRVIRVRDLSKGFRSRFNSKDHIFSVNITTLKIVKDRIFFDVDSIFRKGLYNFRYNSGPYILPYNLEIMYDTVCFQVYI